MKIPAPISSGPTDGTQQQKVVPEWANWLFGVFHALAGWNTSLTASAVLDFGSINPQTQAGLPVTVKGARQGDAVLVTPYSDTGFIIYSGVVTAPDTVTIYAKSITSAGPVNPISMAFRIIVFQN